MADKKISALTGAATPLAGTEVLPIVQSGATVKVSAADVTAGRQVALSSAVAGTGLAAIPWVLNANSSFYQAGSISSIIGTAGIVGVGTELVRNAYYDSGWKYAGGGSASRLVQTGGQLINYRAVSGTANAAVTWIQNLTVDASDNATVNLGNIVIGTAGKGIDFSANTNAPGMTSELLDWYEEGTWTAGISFGGASVGITYANSVGYYTRVGNLVTVNCYLVLSNKGSSTGTARITGLPFTCVNNASGYSALSVLPINVTFAGQLSGYANINDTTIDLVQSTGINLTDVGFANNSTFIFTQTYRVA